MADFPAMPLWTDAYLADTRHLTQAEHGAYMLLLMEAWRRPHCTLPDNDSLLARLSGSPSIEAWLLLKPMVMAFWSLDERTREWTQKRLKKERKFVEKNRAQKRQAARKRWKQTENDNAAASSPHVQPTPTPTPLYSVSSKKEDTAPNGADHSPEADVKRRVYEAGKAALGASAGGMITKAIAQLGLGDVAEVLDDMRKEQPLESRAWFTKAIEARVKRRQRRSSTEFVIGAL